MCRRPSVVSHGVVVVVASVVSHGGLGEAGLKASAAERVSEREDERV